MVKERIQSVDMVKGLALVLISAGYMNWYLEAERPLLFVFLATIEAPLFFLAAGYTMALKADERSWAFFIKRILGLLFFKALIDLGIYGHLPWVDGSSLLTIALGLPLIRGLSRAGSLAYLIGFFFITLAMPLLQDSFGYRQLQTNVDYWYNYPDLGTQLANVKSLADVLRSWFIDGWTPFFPFAGIMLLGAYANSERRRWLARKGTWAAAMTAVAALCYLLWPKFAPTPVPRLGQLELEFPPSIIFTVAYSCLSLLTLIAFELPAAKRALGFLAILGMSPLFNFILVTAIVRLCIFPVITRSMSIPEFVAVWAAVNGTILAATLLLGAAHRRVVKDDSWLLVRMFFGSYRKTG